MEAFEDALDAGEMKDDVINPDSDGEDEAMSKQRNRKRQPFLGENDDERDYDDAGRQDDDDDGDDAADSDASSSKRSTTRGGGLDSDDFVMLGGKKAKHKKVAHEPTRRSDREGARKQVDYGAHAVMDLSDEEAPSSSPEPEDTPESSLDLRNGYGASASASRNASREPKPESRHADFADDAKDEDRPDQYHRDECASCSASDAKTLLPLYKMKEGKKRKVEDGAWDEDSIRNLGA